MARLLIFTILGAVVEAIAVERMVAAPTDISLPSAIFSFAQITAPPSLELLAKRQEAMTVLEAPDNTCGYVGGQLDSAYSCVDTDVKCAIVTYSNLVGAVGCCKGDECAVRATCVDYAELSSSCRVSCQTTPYNLYCTSSASYCGTISYPNGIRDYFCQFTSNTTVGKAYTTYFGEMDDRSYTPRVLEIGSSANPLGPITTTVSPMPPGHDNPTPNNNNSSKGGSSTPIGAIVGGVVGGVAVLVIVALALFFIIRHNNKKKQQQHIAAATGGYPQMTQQPGGPNNVPNASPTAAGAHQSAYNPTYGQPQQYPSPTQSPPPQQAFMNPQQQQQAPPYTYAAAGAGGDMKPQAYAHVQPPSPAASPGIDQHNRQSYNQPASPTMTDVSSIQPHHTGNSMGGGFYPYGNNGSGPNVPTTVHEAGGDAVGTHGPHSNHHGQFHEMQ
ncbi:hypothetical protein PG996_004382 [Apiospora saccharicola]|uniref:Mid2 domain-containing protein n=1 Tax=Apiospora saccharicola TaxID=335842 RepID=A0ABR1W410_9PEZI